MMLARSLKLMAVILVVWGGGALASGEQRGDAGRPVPPTPTDFFGPSNARTEDGKLIPVAAFFSATRCASCHQDTHRAWSESLHRNAAREPFYRESADILLRTRGIEFTRHCESCHTPGALFSGALDKSAAKQAAPFTPLDDEGVTCTVCHSITAARLDGTGSFTLRRPALLAREDGTPIYGDLTDEQILADVPGHKRAVMRPLLKQPEFCSTCHKVDAPPSLNGYKHIKGFSAYDEWQQSGASHESILPFYRREQRTDCRACHMPKVDSANDRAAKQGKIASHRWLGANTAAPLFYGQTEQVEQTKASLQAEVVAIDVFALRREATSELLAPLTRGEPNSLALNPGEELTAEVVVSNRNAAHSFPPEVRDLYEVWVEFEVLDAAGRTIFHSGFVKADGMLDESAHVYKQLILDEQSRPITRHQIWLTNIKAYDNAIQAGRSDVVRFRFRAPAASASAAARSGRSFVGPSITNQPSALTLRARVNYRRLNQEYTDYVLRRQGRQMTVPVVRMAEAKARLVVSGQWSMVSDKQRTPDIKQQTSDARRWNDYGIGLLEQAQYGTAAEAFRRASELDPTDANLLVNAAIAEMRTERFAPERGQWRKAEAWLDRALSIPPTAIRTPSSLLRARYFRALVWRADGKLKEAAEELKLIAHEYPRDREVLRQLAHTFYTLGQLSDARTALEAVTSIDPTDAGAWQILAPLYASEGRRADAERARVLYLQWRDDPRADTVAARFFAAHPEWADERIGAHTHDAHSSNRLILTGKFASPDK